MVCQGTKQRTEYQGHMEKAPIQLFKKIYNDDDRSNNIFDVIEILTFTSVFADSVEVAILEQQENFF